MMKASGVRKSRKKLNQLRGKLRQKEKNGPYYYRLMVANGVRKEFALKTADFEDAFRKATDLDAVYEAPNQEVAIAQINAIKGFSKIVEPLPLSEIWEKYEVHPDHVSAMKSSGFAAVFTSTADVLPLLFFAAIEFQL